MRQCPPAQIVTCVTIVQGSLPDPASCAKYIWEPVTEQICIHTKACDFENNPPPTETCYSQEDAKFEVIVYEQTKQLSNTCFEIIQHEVHCEWITISSPSGHHPDQSGDGKHLGGGPIFGIVLAALITVGVAAYAAYWFITKRHLNPFGNSAYKPFGSGATSSSSAPVSSRSSNMVASAGYQQAPMNQA